MQSENAILHCNDEAIIINENWFLNSSWIFTSTALVDKGREISRLVTTLTWMSKSREFLYEISRHCLHDSAVCLPDSQGSLKLGLACLWRSWAKRATHLLCPPFTVKENEDTQKKWKVTLNHVSLTNFYSATQKAWSSVLVYSRVLGLDNPWSVIHSPWFIRVADPGKANSL